MGSLLEGPLANIVGNAVRSLFTDATLVRDVAGASTESFDPAAPTQVSYPCKGIVETYADRFRLDGTVSENDRKVLITALSLGSVVPQAGDRVTISGTTFSIVDVATDP